jgi:hypothetical protein
MIATLVGATVGVPYFASHSQQRQNAPGSAAPPANRGAATSVVPRPAAVPATAPPLVSNGGPIYYPPTPRQNGSQYTPLNQVLRFDVTKDWVNRTWTRKTVAPTDVGLTSVRVPLVTGTQPSSLAGSLTYFFNARSQVEHISFRGRTGDTAPLVQLLSQHYQFQRVDAGVGEQIYQVRSGDGVQSELRIQAGGVIRSDAPQQNVKVELEFARPGSQRFLPPRGPALQIPQVESPVAAGAASPANSSGQGIGSAIKSAASNYWNQIRYATPEEENAGLWMRWPD